MQRSLTAVAPLTVVFLTSCCWLALPAIAPAQSSDTDPASTSGFTPQSGGGYSRPTRTLGDRLQQFRQDILGGSAPAPQRYATPMQIGQRPAAQPGGGQSPRGFSGVQRVANRPTPAQVAAPVAPSTPPQAMAEDDSDADEPAELPTSRRLRDESAAALPAGRARSPSPLSSLPINAAPENLRARRAQINDASGDDSLDAVAAPVEPAPQRMARKEPSVTPTRPAPPAAAPSSAASRLAVDETAAAHAEKPTAGLLFTSKSAALLLETIGPRAISLGKETEFVIKVRNASDCLANGVMIAIQLPAHVDVVGGNPSSGAVRSPAAADPSKLIEWRINRLDAHAKESLSLKLIARKSSPIELAMQWTTAPDSTQATVEVQEPRLTMSMSGASEILYGQSKVYKITVTNPGNGDAENVVVTLLPVGRAAESGASRRLGTLRPGQSRSIEVELTARQNGNLTIKAEATADGGLSADAVEEVLVRRAHLQIAVQGPKSRYAGMVANYHITISNSGNAAAEGVLLNAVLPAEAKYVSGASGKADGSQGKLAWTVGSLPAGSERTFEVACSLAAAGENRLQVAAVGADDLAASTVAVTHVESVADLKLEIRDPQGPVSLGDEALYEVIVRNRGTKSAEGIDLAVFFSEGLEAVRAHGGGHKIERGQVVFDRIPSLAAGSELTLKIHAKAESATSHIFRAEVVSQSPQLKLAAEETTLFYGDEGTDTSTPATSDDDASVAPLQPPLGR